MTKETWDSFLKVMGDDPNTAILDLTKEKKDMTKKEHNNIDEVLEEFAAKIANQEDNPTIYKDAADEAKNSLKLETISNVKKPFGRGGFGQGKPDDTMYLKELQRNRILKKLDLIKDKLGDMKQIIMLLEEKLDKLQ